MGIKKTVAQIKERFAWKGVFRDVQHIVSFFIEGGNSMETKVLVHYSPLLVVNALHSWNFT